MWSLQYAVAGLSAALRTCVTHSSLVVVQATDVSYRTRRNDAARLQRERTGDNGTDGTRDRKVAVSNVLNGATMPRTYTDTRHRSAERARLLVHRARTQHCYFRREAFDRER